MHAFRDDDRQRADTCVHDYRSILVKRAGEIQQVIACTAVKGHAGEIGICQSIQIDLRSTGAIDEFFHNLGIGNIELDITVTGTVIDLEPAQHQSAQVEPTFVSAGIDGQIKRDLVPDLDIPVIDDIVA